MRKDINNTAKNLLRKGVDKEVIASCTGLILEEIEKLLTQIK